MWGGSRQYSGFYFDLYLYLKRIQSISNGLSVGCSKLKNQNRRNRLKFMVWRTWSRMCCSFDRVIQEQWWSFMSWNWFSPRLSTPFHKNTYTMECGKVVHSSPKETHVFEGYISFGEECISVNLTSFIIDKIDMTLHQGQWPRITRKNGWIKPAFLLGKSVVTPGYTLLDWIWLWADINRNCNIFFILFTKI